MRVEHVLVRTGLLAFTEVAHELLDSRVEVGLGTESRIDDRRFWDAGEDVEEERRGVDSEVREGGSSEGDGDGVAEGRRGCRARGSRGK